MLEIILLIGLIVLVIVLISASRRKRELTEVQTRIAEEEYKRVRKPRAQAQNPQDKYDALSKIKLLLDQGVLTAEEFEKEKKTILQRNKRDFNLSSPHTVVVILGKASELKKIQP